ncbi:MATE family efflux transporter [uncultured Fusobacterium sp.]|uniref:MATE family efflux transporter n=1 Tax=uncultured Fusobacterium sp. TaxID=159267 RepID=UPI0027DDFDD6|nr:MATE family efflux transporter [uncultured Fusobacterium sp.]
MKNTKMDLTTGNVSVQLIKFAVPLFIANLLQAFYNIADMVIVGRIIGSRGVVAISNTSMLCFIINSICIGITLGGTVLIAQYRGKKNNESCKEVINSIFFLIIIISIAVTVLGVLTCRHVFVLLRVPEEALQESIEYMNIIYLGSIFVFGYNSVSSVMKGIGDSQKPLYFVLIAAILNIGLDFFLVGSVNMGIKGAAVATVISQGVSFLLAILYLKRYENIFEFSFKYIKKEKIKDILKIGISAALQMLIINIAYLIMTGLFNGYGMIISAASGIGLKINTFAGMPCWAVGQTVTAMTGQNMGAGKIKRVEEVVKTGIKIGFLLTLITVIFVQLTAEKLVTIFEKENQGIITEGVKYLRICCSVNSLIYSAMYIYDSFAIGVGNSFLAMLNSFLDSIIIKLFLSFIFTYFLSYGVNSLYASQAVSPIIPAAIGWLYYKKGNWKGKIEII